MTLKQNVSELEHKLLYVLRPVNDEWMAAHDLYINELIERGLVEKQRIEVDEFAGVAIGLECEPFYRKHKYYPLTKEGEKMVESLTARGIKVPPLTY